MEMELGTSSTDEARCPECRAQSPFYVRSFVAETERVSVCFACGWRQHQNDAAITTSRIKHKCQARLFLG